MFTFTGKVLSLTAASLMATTAFASAQNMDELVAAAKAEGQLTTIALPHDWCGYGEVIAGFKAKYPEITVNELNPDAGSSDEIEAIKANKDNKGPQAPDVIDVGLSYGPSAKAEGLVQPYKVATWDSIPADAKEAARKGFIAMAKATDFGATGLWTRINALNSPWALNDITEIVGTIGNKLDVMMLPKVEGAWDIHYLDQLLAQLEAKYAVRKPILIHAILETAEGVDNVADIATASPRMHGISLGPADLAASRAMKTTRVGGGHPKYKVLADAPAPAPLPDGPGLERGSARAAFQQDLWHYTIAKMVDACAAAGIKAFYGPFADFADPQACEAQFRNAFVMGCAGAWTLHPSQVPLAKRVFSPDPDEVAFARKILDAMPGGAGAVMIDGKMQDDATWKQAKVLVDLARLVAAKDPDMAARYAL